MAQRKLLNKKAEGKEMEGLEYIGQADSFKIPKWMDCAWRRVGCDKDSCLICGPIKRNYELRLAAGEDPDDIKVVLEDVGRNFKETLELIKRDADRMGIDITNIENIEEPPRPEEFTLYIKVERWRNEIYKLAQEAETDGSFWLYTEEAEDLLWYANTITAKTYRQLCNRWHIGRGDSYGGFDYKYTKYVLEECFIILKKALNTLSAFDGGQKGKLLLSLMYLPALEKEALKI